MRFRKSSSIAAAWGIAEATFFFIVPDVLLSWYAIQSYKKGIFGCVFAMLGALLGGALVWWWRNARPFGYPRNGDRFLLTGTAWVVAEDRPAAIAAEVLADRFDGDAVKLDRAVRRGVR